MKISVRRTCTDVPLPSYAHAGDAALDLRSITDMTIPPGKRTMVPTGIHLAIPDGYVGLVWDRSGLAAKSGMHTMAGVIDSGYRGEVRVVVVNLSDEPFDIRRGDRIAQMLIQPVVIAEVEEVDELPPSPRGSDGFGSTGTK